MKSIKELITLIKECLIGKSLSRTLHNIYLSEIPPFYGNGIDYGAKNAAGSYYRFIDINNTHMTYCDLYPIGNTKVKSINFENNFDLSSESYDFALVMNTLEHVYNHQNFINNISKSLKVGGRLEGCVPFLYPYHKDPDDFFRYSHTALEKILNKANFENIEINKICTGGLLVSASLLSRRLSFKPLILLWWLVSYILSKIFGKTNNQNSDMYALIAFSAIKKSA